MTNKYFNTLPLKETIPFLVSLRTYAEKNDIPVVTLEGMAFIQQIIRLKKVTSILEIGTAIGYSALAMASVDTSIKIKTIERDPHMIKIAQAHLDQYDEHQQIELIDADALDYKHNEDQTYDLIFIDAAKAQSVKFFEKYAPFLNDEGVIITDNLLFHGLVGTTQSSKSLNNLLKKIDAFNHFVLNKEGYHTTIFTIGDGMSLSIKKR